MYGDVRDIRDVVYVYYVVLEALTHCLKPVHELVSLGHPLHGLNECAKDPGSILLPVCQRTGTRTFCFLSCRVETGEVKAADWEMRQIPRCNEGEGDVDRLDGSGRPAIWVA